MSKRFFPQQYGDRKKAKLDISISDHNFPLSQINSPKKECMQTDNWGDDNEDEMLLLASQACENAFSNDTSQLPNYTLCMQPTSSSTQVYSQQLPSTSKVEFIFKKPIPNAPASLSTDLNDKCNRISSPLPGITSKLFPNKPQIVDISDDFIFNDKVYKGQDSDVVFRQLLQLREENAKLKSENGKLLDKCVTKEGEASILRTHLKNCQISVDNARLDKIKAQEKVQMEWNEKLLAANGQVHDLKTELDFKNMEIISIKEKCKKLKSTKVRLTQVTIGENDVSMSYKSNHYVPNESSVQSKGLKTACSSVQTEDKAHFLKLNKTSRLGSSSLQFIIPVILKSPTEQQHSILDYSERLQRHTDFAVNKFRLYSTFHRAPATLMHKASNVKKVHIATVCEDLSAIANGDENFERYFNIFNTTRSILQDVHSRLETISQRMTTAFLKDMDEKYIEATSSCLVFEKMDLLMGKELYKEEQETLARRMIAILSFVLETSRGVEVFDIFEQRSSDQPSLFELINRICILLDNTSCATLYSGFLQSVIHTITNINDRTNKYTDKILTTVKSMLTSRPMPHVCCHLLRIVRKMSLIENFRNTFCFGSHVGNMKMDYDQGVLLYKKDTCYLQILLKQIEVCLKCIESQKLIKMALDVTRNLLVFYTNLNVNIYNVADKARCDCHVVLLQNVVYALRICDLMMNKNDPTFKDSSKSDTQELLALCRCGVEILYKCSIKDVEYSAQLAYNEGHLMEFCEIMKCFDHTEVLTSMLTELSGTLQSSSEDTSPSFHKEIWMKSFETFALTD